MSRTGMSRVRVPLIDAFRAAHEARDARVRLDQRDEAGERIIAGRRSGPRAAMSGAELQRSVARDIERLMNAVNLASDTDLAPFPNVGRSILNHGFCDVAHRSLDEWSVNDIAGEIQAALKAFEPRLVPGSITARRDDGLDPAELKLRFVVRAEIDSEPLNLPVEFVADLERDTGRIKVGQR